jgi:uncharacterized delta-60 repeat protein
MGLRSAFARRVLFGACVAGAFWSATTAVAARPAARFGDDGVAFHFPPGSAREQASRVSIVDLAPATRGKLVAALGSTNAENRYRYFGVARFDADGSLDRSFGRRGFVNLGRTRSGTGSSLLGSQAASVTVEPSGKILVAGWRTPPRDGEHRFPVLVRLLPDGSLDRSFGRAGIVSPRRDPGFGESFADVAVERGGRIVAVGAVAQSPFEFEPGHREPGTLVRAFHPDGRIDRSFGNDGSLHSTVAGGSNSYTSFRSVRVLDSGELLLSGYRRNRLLLERLTADGQPDPSFGDDGSVRVGYETAFSYEAYEKTTSLTLTPGGMILVGATLQSLQDQRPGLVRFFADGRLDKTFGREGVVHGFFGERLQTAGSAFPTAHGSTIVVGTGYEGGIPGESLVALRLNRSGELDETFGRHGFRALAHGSASAGPAALPRPGGGFVAAGSTQFERRTGSRRFPALLTLWRVR